MFEGFFFAETIPRANNGVKIMIVLNEDSSELFYENEFILFTYVNN